MDKARIMVVEDEELVGLSIKVFLERAGYEVPLVTQAGEQAVGRAGEVRPDLVLMDIRLSGEMSGIEAAGILHKTHHIPVIYLTAHDDEDTLEKAKVTEPFGYILKPFDERHLQAAIKMALHKSAAQNALRQTKERMSTILQSVGDGIIVTARDGVIEYQNPTAQALLGLPIGLEGKPSVFKEIRFNDLKGRMAKEPAWDRVLEKGESFSLTEIVMETEQAKCTVDLRVEPHRDERGGIVGMVLAFRDIAERTRIQELIDRELENATAFHKSLLPKDTVDTPFIRMGAFLMPASFGAGDIYGFHAIDSENFGFFMVDVMGHGIAATSTALLLNRLLTPPSTSLLGADPKNPRAVLEALNRLFSDSWDSFFTICYGVIGMRDRSVRMIRAGHPFPVLQKRQGSPVEVRAGGFAVGVVPHLEVPVFETVLDPGEKLLVYSDGLTDCADPGGERFSRDTLLRVIQETAADDVVETVARIKAAVLAWRGRDLFDDDVSLIALQAT
jgi:PAS domain S-box-containing protein